MFTNCFVNSLSIFLKACYGIEEIPDGPWLCDTCKAKDGVHKCALCPNVGGAMKSTG